jgi:hypothetical protein
VSTLTKVFVVLTAVLSIAMTCLFMAAASQWQNYRELTDTLQDQRDSAVTGQQNAVAMQAAALALKDDQLRDTREALEKALADRTKLNDDLAKLRNDLTQEKNEKLAADARATKFQEMLEVTSAERNALQKQNQTLVAQNLDQQSRLSRSNSRVLELTTNLTILKDELRNMQEKLIAAEGGRAITRAPDVPSGVTAMQPPARTDIRGEIVDVSAGYASVNVGEASGVSVGMTLMVYRNGSYLGDLKIESVRPNESGGRLDTLARGDIRPGDRVMSGMN